MTMTQIDVRVLLQCSLSLSHYFPLIVSMNSREKASVTYERLATTWFFPLQVRLEFSSNYFLQSSAKISSDCLRWTKRGLPISIWVHPTYTGVAETKNHGRRHLFDEKIDCGATVPSFGDDYRNSSRANERILQIEILYLYLRWRALLASDRGRCFSRMAVPVSRKIRQNYRE